MTTAKTVDTTGKHIVHAAEVVLVTGMLTLGAYKTIELLRGEPQARSAAPTASSQTTNNYYGRSRQPRKERVPNVPKSRPEAGLDTVHRQADQPTRQQPVTDNNSNRSDDGAGDVAQQQNTVYVNQVVPGGYEVFAPYGTVFTVYASSAFLNLWLLNEFYDRGYGFDWCHYGYGWRPNNYRMLRREGYRGHWGESRLDNGRTFFISQGDYNRDATRTEPARGSASTRRIMQRPSMPRFNQPGRERVRNFPLQPQIRERGAAQQHYAMPNQQNFLRRGNNATGQRIRTQSGVHAQQQGRRR